MKRFYLVLFVLFLLFGFCGISSATLSDYGNGIIRDDMGTMDDNTDDLYWYPYLSDFAGTNWAEKIDIINGINNNTSYTNFAYGVFQLASDSEMTTLTAYFTESFNIGEFFQPSISYGDVDLYYGIYDVVSMTEIGVSGHFSKKIQDTGSRLNILSDEFTLDNIVYEDFGAWVVASATGMSGNTTPTPEPSTMLLLGAGLFGLAGVTRRKLKK